MERYIYYAVIGAECILSVILFFSSLSARKNRKLDNVANQLELKISHLKNTIPLLVSEAEDMFGAGNGIAKLQYVLNKLHIQCLELSVPYDKEELTKCIDDVLSAPQKKMEKKEIE